MKRRRILLILILAFAIFGLVLLGWNPVRDLLGLTPPVPLTAPVTQENSANVGALLGDLVLAYGNPQDAEANQAKIRRDLETIRSVNERDYELAESIADHWEKVYLDPDYTLNLHDGGEKAEALADSGIPDSRNHAIVVLGYQLEDGKMQPELMLRCEAAAAVAREFPNTILVCSGGATGSNNPEGHTEAGLMKEYLTEQCGIDAARIYTDEQAMTTQENAVNTLKILQANGVRSITIVTSSYHQRWGESVYQAIAAVYRQQQGYAVDIIGNYACDVEPGVPAYRNDAQIAVRQIAGILELPREVIQALPSVQKAAAAEEPAAEDAEPMEEPAEEPAAEDIAPAEEPADEPAEEPAVENAESEMEPVEVPAAEDAEPAEEPAEAPELAALDYADADNWAWLAEGEDRGVDIFLICPTVDTRSDRNALELDDWLKSRFVSALEMERGIYEEAGRLFSPYYRQISMNAYSLPEAEREQAAEIACRDVEDAFRWYLENENDGRGIILAGFSQGAEMCLRLLEDFYGGDGEEAQALRQQLVTVYAVGWRLTEELTDACPWIVPASGEFDTGSVVCFDCEDGSLSGTIIIPEGVRTCSINPLNWMTDSTPADRSLNLGAVFSATADPVPELCGAVIGERGEIIVTDVSAEDYPPVLDILPEGSLHLYDYMFFHTNLKKNVLDRAEAWFAGQTAAQAVGAEALPAAA